MAIVLEDPNESRDRRLKMLLDTATSAMQIQNQKQQLSQQAQQNAIENTMQAQDLSNEAKRIALADPAQNKYLRAELATQNRSRMADARYKDNLPSYQAKSDIMLQRQLELQNNMRSYKASEEAPMTADAAGRYQFAKESLRNIPKLESMLFSGENGEFRQDVATKLMYPWKYPKDKEVQNAKRWIIGMATARGLIQSGTVVKDSEWGRIMQQFGIDAFSDEQAIKDALGEQKEFMSGFKKSVRPGSGDDEAPKLTGKTKSLYEKYAGD